MGPLFIPRIQRPLARPKGKEGHVHRLQTRRATPKWADMRAIEAIYAEARRKTQETGELYVVDHIVPKISPLVCGLHVQGNLRVIHWRLNTLKGAWEWPDMPHEQMELSCILESPGNAPAANTQSSAFPIKLLTSTRNAAIAANP